MLAVSVWLSRSLPPAPFGAPPGRLRAGVCAREGEGVGGVGGGLPVPGRSAEGGGGCEGLREAMDVERLQEALKGGGSCPVSLPSHPPRSYLPSGKWFRGAGLGGEGALPRLPSPSRFPGGGEPRGQLPPALLWALCRPPASGLGEGSREALAGAPAPLPLPGHGSWARSAFPGGFVLHQAPARRATAGRKKVKGLGWGRGGRQSNFQVSQGAFFRASEVIFPRALIVRWSPSKQQASEQWFSNLGKHDFSVLRIRL